MASGNFVFVAKEIDSKFLNNLFVCLYSPLRRTSWAALWSLKCQTEND